MNTYFYSKHAFQRKSQRGISESVTNFILETYDIIITSYGADKLSVSRAALNKMLKEKSISLERKKFISKHYSRITRTVLVIDGLTIITLY